MLVGSVGAEEGAPKGFFLLVLITCLIVGSVVECGAQDRRRQANAEGVVYRRPLGHDAQTLDPARISDIYGRSIAQQVFDGLVQFDRTLTVVPALAQFWRASRDGLTWTFTLRKGVKFHHGREVTADDVVYSFTRILDPRVKSTAADLFMSIRGAREFRRGAVKSVSGLAALDRYTVQVTLEDARVPFVSVLAVGHAKIVPRDVVERDPDGFATHPIGTGPFRFVHWKRDKEIVLAANADYFGGAPKISQLIYRIFQGERADEMYEEFQKGRLEDTPIPMRNYREILARKNAFIYVKRPMLSLRFYGFNTRIAPFRDRRVRQAFLFAVDREALLRDVFLGRYALAQGILPPGTQGFNPRLKEHEYNPETVRRLLAQAGYPDGRGLPPVEILSSVNDEMFVRMHEHVIRDLAAVGIKARVHYQTDWPTFSEMVAAGRFQIFLYTWYADVPDPDNFLSKLFYSRSSRNFFGYSNPAVDDLLVRAQNERDLPRRMDLYRSAEQLIMDDAPLIPIFHYTYERLFQPYVRSVEVNGLGDPYIPLRKIWLDRRN